MLTILLKIKKTTVINLDNAFENRIINQLREGALCFPPDKPSKRKEFK